jgi:hypothetical protein
VNPRVEATHRSFLGERGAASAWKELAAASSGSKSQVVKILCKRRFPALTSSYLMVESPNPLLLSCQTGSLFFDN